MDTEPLPGPEGDYPAAAQILFVMDIFLSIVKLDCTFIKNQEVILYWNRSISIHGRVRSQKIAVSILSTVNNPSAVSMWLKRTSDNEIRRIKKLMLNL